MGKTAGPLPRCGSLDTRRRSKLRSSPTTLDGSLKPLQRFSCSDCDSTFTSERKLAPPRARFSDAVVNEAVRLYVQGLSS